MPEITTGRSTLYQGKVIKDPTLLSVLERLDRLEKGGIVLKRLPLKELRQAIMFDQPQDPIQLFLPKSVTKELLSDAVLKLFLQVAVDEEWKIDIGETETSFPGGTTTSLISTVPHQLGREPKAIMLTSFATEASVTAFSPRVITGSLTATQFKYRVYAPTNTAVIAEFPGMFLAIG